jgi:hypothetical protein
MTKSVAEVQKQQVVLRSAYQRLFNSPDAQLVMADLYLQFNGTTLKYYRNPVGPTQKQGDRVIDPTASIAAAGCREVLLYIELMTRERNAASN